MKIKIGRKKLHLLFVSLLIILGFSLRVVYLNVIPPGLANDESNVILNAQSIVKTGKNIPGVVTGIIGKPAGDYISGAHGELSSYFIAMIYLFTGFSEKTARIPFAIFSMGVVLFLYLISEKLFKRGVSYILLVFAVFNPWLIQFGRAGYESIISSFFYIVAIYVFLKTRGWKIFYSLPFLLAGFLSYFSAKVLLLPLSISFLLYLFLLGKSDKKRSIKPVIYLNVFVIIFLVLYSLLLTKSYPGARISELTGNPYATIVDYKRTHSISFPFVSIVENKFIEDFYYRVDKTLGGISATFLFLNGLPESSGHLKIPDQGPLYLLDFLFIIVGFIYLSRNYLKESIFLLFLTMITFLPNFLDIGNTTYSMRQVILIPILIIVSAVGAYALYELIRDNYKKKIVYLWLGVLLCITYIFFISRFIFQYYYRLPIENNDAFFFQDRIATSYIKRYLYKNPNMTVEWVVKDKHFSLFRYLYFSGIYKNREDINSVNRLLEDKIYDLGNLNISDTCPENYTNGSLYIFDATLKCINQEGNVLIPNINDAGAKYVLANDPVCKTYEHKRYPLIRSFKILYLENLEDGDFCVNYITKQS